jgi:hypothetical protein
LLFSCSNCKYYISRLKKEKRFFGEEKKKKTLLVPQATTMVIFNTKNHYSMSNNTWITTNPSTDIALTETPMLPQTSCPLLSLAPLQRLPLPLPQPPALLSLRLYPSAPHCNIFIGISVEHNRMGLKLISKYTRGGFPYLEQSAEQEQGLLEQEEVVCLLSEA